MSGPWAASLACSRATCTFSAIQPPQFAYGPVGTTATTAAGQRRPSAAHPGVARSTFPWRRRARPRRCRHVTCQNNALKKVTISVDGCGINRQRDVSAAGRGSATLTESNYSGSPSFTTVPPTTTTIGASGSNPVTTTASLDLLGHPIASLSTAAMAVLAPSSRRRASPSVASRRLT